MKYVKADKPMTVTNEKLGEIELDNFEYPQFESIEEYQSVAPKPEDALDYLNKSVAEDAKAKGRAQLKALPQNANQEVAKGKIRDSIRSFDPFVTAERATTINKEKAATLDNAKAQFEAAIAAGRTLSMDEMAQLFALANA